jgi:hypothetical protein
VKVINDVVKVINDVAKVFNDVAKVFNDVVKVFNDVAKVFNDITKVFKDLNYRFIETKKPYQCKSARFFVSTKELQKCNLLMFYNNMLFNTLFFICNDNNIFTIRQSGYFHFDRSKLLVFHLIIFDDLPAFRFQRDG